MGNWTIWKYCASRYGASGLPASPGGAGLQGYEQCGREAQGAGRLPLGEGKLPKDLRPAGRGGLEEEEASLHRLLSYLVFNEIIKNQFSHYKPQ